MQVKGILQYFRPSLTFTICLWDFFGRVAQWVTCLSTDASLYADPGAASSIPVRSHTFVEIDHEIIATVILLPSAESFKKGPSRIGAVVSYKRKYVHKVLVNCLFKLAQKIVVRWNDRPAITIAVDLGRKATKQTKKLVTICDTGLIISLKIKM